jgi:hypothetical protein
MLLFTILAFIVIFMIILICSGVGFFGAGFVIIFADVIVCVVLICLLIKFLASKK